MSREERELMMELERVTSRDSESNDLDRFSERLFFQPTEHVSPASQRGVELVCHAELHRIPSVLYGRIHSKSARLKCRSFTAYRKGRIWQGTAAATASPTRKY